MIDQSTIAVLPDQIQVKPHLIADKAPEIDAWLLPMRCHRGDDAKKTEIALHPVYRSWFDLFADGALRVYTRSTEREDTVKSEQFVYLIELNLRKILWGHNGINIQDGDDVCNALLIVRHALQQLLVNPGEASELIPGIGERQLAYWQSMELAMDLRDPGLEIRRRMEWMRSPRVRRKPEFYENTTLLDGKNLKIKAYDKIEQMRDKHKVPRKTIEVADDPITRLEMKMKGKEVTNFSEVEEFGIGSPELLPKMTEIRGKRRLTGFTWEQLKAIHRHCFKHLKSVYHVAAEKGAPPAKSYAAVYAAIALENDIHPGAIYDLVTSYSGRASGTCENIRKAMEWYIGQSSTLTSKELLSDENYRNQPGLSVSGLDGCKFYVKHYGWSEISEALPEIREVYGDTQPTRFVDMGAKPYLLWEFEADR